MIGIYRNKKSPIIRVKEERKNEDGCLSCVLFDVCLEWAGKDKSICQQMEEAGIIVESYDLYFSKYGNQDNQRREESGGEEK